MTLSDSASAQGPRPSQSGKGNGIPARQRVRRMSTGLMNLPGDGTDHADHSGFVSETAAVKEKRRASKMIVGLDVGK